MMKIARLLFTCLLLLIASEKSFAVYNETIFTSKTIPLKGTSAVVTFQKNNGTSKPQKTSNNSIRLYGKGTLIITPNDDFELTKIDYYYKINKSNGSSPVPTLTSTDGSFQSTSFGGSWTGSTTQPIILLSDGTKGNIEFSRVIITFDYRNGKQDTYTSFVTKEFTLRIGRDNYATFNGQKAKTAPDGLPLIYSSDNESVAMVDTMTGAVRLKNNLGTATIKSSFAGNDSLNPSSDSYKIIVNPYHEGTAESPYSVAEIYALRDAKRYIQEGDSIYVSGFITKIKSFAGGMITYYISDDISAQQQLLVYDNCNFNKTKFKSKNDLAVGWFVTIKGRNRVIDTTPQIRGGYVTKISKDAVNSPIISGCTAFLDSSLVTLSADEAKAKIYYTTDGSAPTELSAEYAAPFSLGASATVKAVSYFNGEKSIVVSQEFKKVGKSELVTVADALKAADGARVYVRGTVARTEKYSGESSLNYYINDTEDVSNGIKVDNGKYLQNTDIVSAFQIVRGDEVCVAAKVGDSDGVKVLKAPQLMSIAKCKDQAQVGTAGWATFVSRRPVDFSYTPAISAYIVNYSADDNNVTLSPVTAIPGNIAVVVKAEAGTYTLQYGNENTTVGVNDLAFSDTSKNVDKAFNIYVLAKQNNGCGFYPVKANTTIAPFKGYLAIGHSSKYRAKPYYAIDTTTTSIANPVYKPKKMEDARYNLSGQRVNTNYRGLVIVNGRKAISK